jgi:hypothetical protein
LEPKRLAIGLNGELWILDAGNNLVEVFNQKGEYVTKFGPPAQAKDRWNFQLAWLSIQRGTYG